MSTTFAPVSEVTCVQATADTARAPNPITAATPGVIIRPAASFLTPTLCSWLNPPYYEVPLSLKKKDQIDTLRLNAVDCVDPSQRLTAEPEAQPAPEPTPEVVPQSSGEAVPEPVQEPVHEYVPEAIHEYVPEVVPEPVHEYGPEAIHEFVPEAVQEFAPQPVQEYVQECVQEHVQEYAPQAVSEITSETLPTTQEVTVNNQATSQYPVESNPLEGFDVSKLAPQMLEVASESQVSHMQTVSNFLHKGGESAKTFGKIFLNDLALQKTVLSGLMNEPGNPLSHIEFLHKELALRLAACGQARQMAQLLLADV